MLKAPIGCISNNSLCYALLYYLHYQYLSTSARVSAVEIFTAWGKKVG